jgi:hypothetical protein
MNNDRGPGLPPGFGATEVETVKVTFESMSKANKSKQIVTVGATEKSVRPRS